MNATQTRRFRRGTAYILAIVLMAIFVGLAASVAAMTNMNARGGKNAADMQKAGLAAESGMAFAYREMCYLAVPGTTNDTNVIANTAQAFQQRLAGTGNLGPGNVTHSASTVFVPAIATDDGSFEIRIVQHADKSLTLEVHGQAGLVRRIVAMNLELTPGHPNSVFNYGLASRGPITISGNGSILGKNQLTEASVISTTNSAVAVTLAGNAVVDGDVSTVGDPTSVVISGSPTVAGTQNPAEIAEHIHFGVEPPVFPEVDTSIFRPLATNIVDQTTNTSQKGEVFENILIKAGTNPTFASDVVINGIVFIESPNIVNFSGKVTLNGMVATEQSAGSSIQDCKLHFEGQVEAYGVETLPALPQFATIRQMPGTFIAAPGFGVKFAGQFSTINGTIAGECLEFSGQSVGTVKGSVIGLGDHTTTVSGLVDIIIDRSGSGGDDPGFIIPMSLKADPKTYREYVTAGTS